jgi:hypothetical protein
MMRQIVLTAACCIGTGLSGCVTDDFDDITRVFDVPTPGEAARWALDQHDPDRRREGLVLLSTASFGGAQVYVDLYRDYVENDPDPLVKSAAIAALARHGTPQDALLIAPWTQLSVTKSVTIRWAAVLGLQRIHNPDVVSILVDVTINPQEQSEVRSAACVAMGQYAEDRVVQALIISLDARELSINVDAAESLSLLTGQSFGLDHEAWQHWYVAASAKGNAFADGREYFYPTYTRDSVWWEYAAFWLDENYEPSLRPVGLKDSSERQTWDDFDAGSSGAGDRSEPTNDG